MAMTREEMLKMLDLGARAPGSGGANRKEKPGDFITKKTKATVDSSRPSTPNALVIDEWDERRGSEIASKVKGDRRYRDMTDGMSIETLRIDMSDMFAACFSCSPKLADNCADPYKGEFVKELLDSTTHKSLRVSTELDDAASEIAAIKMYESFQKSKARGRSAGTAAEEASDEAEEAIDELEKASIALGMGYASKSKDKTVRSENVLAMYDRIRRNPTLRRIVDLAGKMRLFGQSQQKRKTVHGSEDLIGITLGDDVSRLVSSEQAALCIPTVKLDALRRIVEKQAMIKHMVNHEPVAKGPFIAVVDESGSMNGTKVEQAKALALSMAWIARSQGRWAGLIAYSGETGHRLLALPPGKWDEKALCDWLEQFLGGGSCLDLPIREMPDFYKQIGAPVGKTDVIFVTDAYCEISGSDQEKFLAWKKHAKVKLTSLVISSNSGALDAISDDVYVLPSIDLEQEGVQKALAF